MYSARVLHHKVAASPFYLPPEMAKAMRAAIKETGVCKLFSANITADDPEEMIARGKYILSQFGPLGECTAFLVDGYGIGARQILE